MRRRLHRDGREHLHEVIDDHVAQRPDRVVEVAAVGNAEVLGHRDLHAVDVIAVPHRFEHRVAEAQVEDLLEAHLAEVVVDPEDLRLVDVAVQLGGERPSRLQIVAERLLDDDAGVFGETGIRKALHDHREQTGRNLQVEHRMLCTAERRADAGVGGVVGEVALHIAQAGGEARERGFVELLAGGDDRCASAFDELVDRPIVDGDPDDGAVEKSSLLEPVERPEGHHPCQVARDAEDHEHVRCRIAFGLSVLHQRRAPSFSYGQRSAVCRGCGTVQRRAAVTLRGAPWSGPGRRRPIRGRAGSRGSPRR